MAQHQDPREPEVRQFQQIEGKVATLGGESKGLTARYCAYNQSRERFLSAAVEIAGFSAGSIDAHLPALTPGSGGALWIVPSRDISPVSVRVPLDLLYLDRNCVVVDTVQSFPITAASPCSSLSASTLVLPADTIATGKIRPGDSLILCPPEEMKQRLEEFAHAKSETQESQRADSGPGIASSNDEQAGTAIGDALTLDLDDRLHADMPTGNSNGEGMRSAESPSRAPESALLPEIAEPAPGPRKGAKNWLRRLFLGDPPDPRKASRESLSWLVVYFFTGGTPVAHTVGDVSLTGMYVLTEERWYLGTVVRMTLTDRRDPSVDRSITINAKVVRWGSDGVGLEFLLHDNRITDSCMAVAPDDRFVQVSKVQIEQFLRRLRAGTR